MSASYYVSFFEKNLFLPQFRTSFFFFFPVTCLFLWNRIGNGSLIRFMCLDKKCAQWLHFWNWTLFSLFDAKLLFHFPADARRRITVSLKKLTFHLPLSSDNPPSWRKLNENQIVHEISNSVAMYYAAITMQIDIFFANVFDLFFKIYIIFSLFNISKGTAFLHQSVAKTVALWKLARSI